jgi:hypothetical protein
MFYPMTRAPRSLELHWSTETGSGDAALPLDFLHGLHVPAVPADRSTQNDVKPQTYWVVCPHELGMLGKRSSRRRAVRSSRVHSDIMEGCHPPAVF